MSEVNDSIILKDIVSKISIQSALTESEALEEINSSCIKTEWLDFFAPKIMELANKGESVENIKIECHYLMYKIILAGGLEKYKLIFKPPTNLNRSTK